MSDEVYAGIRPFILESAGNKPFSLNTIETMNPIKRLNSLLCQADIHRRTGTMDDARKTVEETRKDALELRIAADAAEKAVAYMDGLCNQPKPEPESETKELPVGSEVSSEAPPEPPAIGEYRDESPGQKRKGR